MSDTTGYADLDRYWDQYDSEGSLDLSDLRSLLEEVQQLRTEIKAIVGSRA